MDLGAFLPPGAQAALQIIPMGEDGPATPGRLIRREERLSWLCAAPQTPGQRLSLTLELPGYSLTRTGDLRPAGKADKAAVALLAEVLGCRPWGEEYALRLSLLGRVWP